MASFVAVSRRSACPTALQFTDDTSVADGSDSWRHAVPVLSGGTSTLRVVVMSDHAWFSIVSLEATCISSQAYTTAHSAEDHATLDIDQAQQSSIESLWADRCDIIVCRFQHCGNHQQQCQQSIRLDSSHIRGELAHLSPETFSLSCSAAQGALCGRKVVLQ